MSILAQYDELSRNLFRRTFSREEAGDRHRIRWIDASDEYCQAAIAAPSSAVLAEVTRMICTRVADPWNPTSFSAPEQRIAENFILAWASCHAAWTHSSGQFIDSLRTVLPHLPDKNDAQKIIDGLERYWRALASFTQAHPNSYHELVLPPPESAGAEKNLISTKRLVIPRRIDLQRINAKLQGKWNRTSLLNKLSAARQVNGLDERFLDCLAQLERELVTIAGPTKRLRDIWKKVEAYLTHQENQDAVAASAIIAWLPNEYDPPSFLRSSISDDELTARIEEHGLTDALKTTQSWIPQPPTQPNENIFLFTPTGCAGISSVTSDASDSISFVIAHQNIKVSLSRMLGEPQQSTDDSWFIWEISPARSLALDDLPVGLEEITSLLRGMRNPRISIQGGIRSSENEYILASGMLPTVSIHAASSVRCVGPAGPQMLGPQGNNAQWEKIALTPGEYMLEAHDAEGEILARRKIRFTATADCGEQTLHFANPPQRMRLCDVHPASSSKNDQISVLQPGATPSIWPMEASPEMCDLTAWFARAVYLGPRIGEMTADPRPGSGWAVRFDGKDDPMLTWEGTATPPDPDPHQQNADKGACRAWRKAFTKVRQANAFTPEAHACLAQYRQVARDIKTVRSPTALGERPATRLALDFDEIQSVPTNHRVESALAIMAILAGRRNARSLAGWQHSSEGPTRDPDKLLSWLPDALGIEHDLGKPLIWDVLRAWQEIGLIDITPSIVDSGQRWVARDPTWVTGQVSEKVHATLLGLVHPTAQRRIAEQCARLGCVVQILGGEWEWSPKLLRCTFPTQLRSRFQEWCAHAGLKIATMPWSGAEWPEWMVPFKQLAQRYSTGFEDIPDHLRPDIASWAFDEQNAGFSKTPWSPASLVWKRPYRPGSVPLWLARTSVGIKCTPHRDEAFLLAVADKAQGLFVRKHGSIYGPSPKRGLIGIRAPLALGRLSAATGPSLPGPSPGGWRYPLANRFFAESLARHLGFQVGDTKC
ncbi:MAG: hypothetical protein H0U72_13275 [Nitrosospira sp.]|nr:hypothetical protein [Nitrosospira sp.]